MLTDFSADVPVDEDVNYFFCYGQRPASIPSNEGIQIEETDDRIAVCTGPLRFVVNRRQFSLIESAELGHLDAEGRHSSQNTNSTVKERGFCVPY